MSFWNCQNEAELPVNRVAVYKATEGPNGPPLVCSLESRRPGQLVLKEWEYGTAPPGYALSASCLPLEHGHAYDVRATGSGVGVRQFHVHPNGRVEALGTACQQ